MEVKGHYNYNRNWTVKKFDDPTIPEQQLFRTKNVSFGQFHTDGCNRVTSVAKYVEGDFEYEIKMDIKIKPLKRTAEDTSPKQVEQSEINDNDITINALRRQGYKTTYDDGDWDGD